MSVSTESLKCKEQWLREEKSGTQNIHAKCNAMGDDRTYRL